MPYVKNKKKRHKYRYNNAAALCTGLNIPQASYHNPMTSSFIIIHFYLLISSVSLVHINTVPFIFSYVVFSFPSSLLYGDILFSSSFTSSLLFCHRRFSSQSLSFLIFVSLFFRLSFVLSCSLSQSLFVFNSSYPHLSCHIHSLLLLLLLRFLVLL